MKQFASKQFQIWLAVCIALVVVLIGLVYFAQRPNDEVSWLGADRAGRQAFVQSINSDDRGVTARLAGSTQTTLQYNVQTDEAVSRATLAVLEQQLRLPYQSFTDQYRDVITLRKDVTISKTELAERLEEEGARTVEDFYAALGFKRVEIYKYDAFVAAKDIDVSP